MSDPDLHDDQGYERAVRAVDRARRKVMALYGGNLDHPALDHLENAIAALATVHVMCPPRRDSDR